MDSVTSDADQMVGRVLIMWDRRVLEKLEILVGSFSVWWMALFGHVQRCMAQMIIVGGGRCGMSWLVFGVIGMFHGVVWGISISFIFQVNRWAVQVLCRL